MPRRRRRWGRGSVVPPASPGGTWSIRYPTGSGRGYESGFPSEALAEAALDARRVDRARERIGLPVDLARLPTLAELGDEWIKRRAATVRSGAKESPLWRHHLRPALGQLRGPEVDVAWVRRYVEGQRAEGYSGATVRLRVRLLSQLLQDCAERPRETGVAGNVAVGLPRSVRALIRPDYDPTTTPYVESLRDVERIAAALDEPIRTGYALGVLAGLRTGEVRALRWESVDLDRRLLYVREAVGTSGRVGPTKNSETRVLPIAPELLAVLRARRLAAGGTGLVVPSSYAGRRSGPKRVRARGVVRSQTLNEHLGAALAALGLARPGLDWYRATRHSYASHYVLAGGSLDHLARLLGHASTETTRRYAHLRPERLAEADVARISVDLVAPRGTVATGNWQRTGRRTRQPTTAARRKRNTG